MNSFKKTLMIWAGVIILMTLVAYIPAMQGGYIWDDDVHVTDNSTLRTPDGLRRIWFELGAVPQYYPLVHTTFWVEYHLYQLEPFGYHLVNVLLHAFNAVFLWLVLRYLGIPGAWLAAAFFALHPVHVESVAWVTERKNVLSSFFYLAAVLAYLRFVDFERESESSFDSDKEHHLWLNNTRHPWLFYALALFLYLCALLSKTVACSMPAAILLILWWKKTRVKWRDILALIPFFTVGVGLGLVTVWMEKYHVGAQGKEWALSFVDRCLIAGRALWFYASKLVWPHKLIFNYPRWQIDSGVWWQYLFPLAVLGVIFILWLLRSRITKAPLVAVLFFAGTLVPALGFFDVYPMQFSFVADHFQYLASIGLIVLFAAGIMTVLRRLDPLPSKIGCAACLAVLFVFAFCVWQQGKIYGDSEALYRDTISKNPDAFMPHNNLGNVLFAQGKLDEAISHYSEALRIKPDYALAYSNLAGVLIDQGKLNEALSLLFKALRLDPYTKDVHYNLGVALSRKGKLDEAIVHYREDLRIFPRHVEAHTNLGNALIAQGKLDEAISHYYKAMRLDPSAEKAHNNLGFALFKKGIIDEAIVHYREALRINPDYTLAHGNLQIALEKQRNSSRDSFTKIQKRPERNSEDPILHYNLGNMHKAKGQLNEAIEQYKKALAIQPGFTEAMNKLALLHVSKGEYGKALPLYMRMIELQPDSFVAYYNMACMYARQNKVEESVDWLRRAVERGFKDWDLLKDDEDLKNIRGSVYFKKLIDTH